MAGQAGRRLPKNMHSLRHQHSANIRQYIRYNNAEEAAAFRAKNRQPASQQMRNKQANMQMSLVFSIFLLLRWVFAHFYFILFLLIFANSQHNNKRHEWHASQNGKKLK